MCLEDLCITVTLELGSLLMAVVAGTAAWLHHRRCRESEKNGRIQRPEV